MLKLSTLFFTFCFTFSFYGQVPKFKSLSTPIKAPSFHNNTEAYFKTDSGVVWITNYLNKEIGISRINNDFNKSESNIVKIDASLAEYQIGTFKLGENIYSLSSNVYESGGKIIARKINEFHTGFEKERTILQSPYKMAPEIGQVTGQGETMIEGFKKKVGQFYVKVSSDNSHLLIAFRKKSDEDSPNYIYFVTLFNSELEQIWTTEVKFPLKKNSMTTPDFFINKNKVIATYLGKSSSKVKGIDSYGYITIEEDDISDFGGKIEGQNGFGHFQQLNDGRIAFIGLNSSSPERNMFQSFRLVVINTETHDEVRDIYHEFDSYLFAEFLVKRFRSPVSEIERFVENGEEIGVYGLVIDQVFSREDGGFYVVFKQFLKEPRHTFSNSYSAERSTLIMLIDKHNNVTHSHKIPKVVEITKGRGTKSFLYNDMLYTFFWDNILNKDIVSNDNTTQELVPITTFNFVCVITSPDGEIEKKVIHTFTKKNRFLPFVNSMIELSPGNYAIEIANREQIQSYMVVLRALLIKM